MPTKKKNFLQESCHTQFINYLPFPGRGFKPISLISLTQGAEHCLHSASHKGYHLRSVSTDTPLTHFFFFFKQAKETRTVRRTPSVQRLTQLINQAAFFTLFKMYLSSSAGQITESPFHRPTTFIVILVNQLQILSWFCRTSALQAGISENLIRSPDM